MGYGVLSPVLFATASPLIYFAVILSFYLPSIFLCLFLFLWLSLLVSVVEVQGLKGLITIIIITNTTHSPHLHIHR